MSTKKLRYIYKIVDNRLPSDSNIIYIGQTSNPADRWYRHLHRDVVYKEIKKDPTASTSDFQFKILEEYESTIPEIESREDYWINYYNDNGHPLRNSSNSENYARVNNYRVSLSHTPEANAKRLANSNYWSDSHRENLARSVVASNKDEANRLKRKKSRSRYILEYLPTSEVVYGHKDLKRLIESLGYSITQWSSQKMLQYYYNGATCEFLETNNELINKFKIYDK